MARFCTKCGRPLKEGEVCNCTAQNAGGAQNAGASQGQPGGRQNYQQGQPGGRQNYQQGQPGGQQYYQQGQPGGQQYYQQGQPGGQQYYQQGQPGGQQYDQQGQPGGQQYYQQGQPGGQQYYQQGPTKEMEWLNKQKDAFVSGTKTMFSEIGPIIKAPVSRVRKISESNSPMVGIEFIVAKTIVFLVVVLIAMAIIAGKIESASHGYAEVDMPYFRAILIVLIMTAGVDFLEAVIMKALTGAFGGRTNVNTMINIIGARAIYDTCVFLIVVILWLMAWEVAIGAFVLLSPISTFIQFAAYQGCVQQMNENRKPYAYFIAKLCMSVISALVVYLIARSIISAAFDSIF